MPLIHSKSAAAFKQNVKTLMGERGVSPHVKDAKQALAIAYATKRRGRAMGGNAFPSFKPPSSNPSFAVRGEAHNMMHTGPILSAVPGRTDNHAMAVPSGSYVIPAESISHLGQSNTLAGMKVANNMFGPMGPYGAGADMKMGRGMGIPKPPHAASLSDVGGARGKGDGSPVDVLTAGGEYIVRPEIVARIGGGNLKHGHEILDKWIMALRKDHIKTLKHLKPPAKS